MYCELQFYGINFVSCILYGINLVSCIARQKSNECSLMTFSVYFAAIKSNQREVHWTCYISNTIWQKVQNSIPQPHQNIAWSRLVKWVFAIHSNNTLHHIILQNRARSRLGSALSAGAVSVNQATPATQCNTNAVHYTLCN